MKRLFSVPLLLLISIHESTQRGPPGTPGAVSDPQPTQNIPVTVAPIRRQPVIQTTWAPQTTPWQQQQPQSDWSQSGGQWGQDWRERRPPPPPPPPPPEEFDEWGRWRRPRPPWWERPPHWHHHHPPPPWGPPPPGPPPPGPPPPGPPPPRPPPPEFSSWRSWRS